MTNIFFERRFILYNPSLKFLVYKTYILSVLEIIYAFKFLADMS